MANRSAPTQQRQLTRQAFEVDIVVLLHLVQKLSPSLHAILEVAVALAAARRGRAAVSVRTKHEAGVAPPWLLLLPMHCKPASKLRCFWWVRQSGVPCHATLCCAAQRGWPRTTGCCGWAPGTCVRERGRARRRASKTCHAPPARCPASTHAAGSSPAMRGTTGRAASRAGSNSEHQMVAPAVVNPLIHCAQQLLPPWPTRSAALRLLLCC